MVPWGENHRYDLVAEKDNSFLRIQVKFVSPRRGCLTVPLRSANNWKAVKYSKKEIDLIAAYNPENEKMYFIPLELFENTATINLRLSSSKNNQKRGVIPAEKYENNVCFADVAQLVERAICNR